MQLSTSNPCRLLHWVAHAIALMHTGGTCAAAPEAAHLQCNRPNKAPTCRYVLRSSVPSTLTDTTSYRGHIECASMRENYSR